MAPFGIAIVGPDVFWASNYNSPASSVMKAPLAGGTATTIASGMNPVAMTTDGVNVYWLDEGLGTLNTVPGDGCSPIVLATGPSPVALAVDDTDVYWTTLGVNTQGALMRIPIAGGTPTPVVIGKGVSFGVAVDAACVYWFNQTAGDPATIMKLAK